MFHRLISLLAFIIILLSANHSSACVSSPFKPIENMLPAEWSKPVPCPAEVLVAADVPEEVKIDMQKTLAEAAKEWGNFGPVEYWVMGSDEEAGKQLVQQYCKRRDDRKDWDLNSCLRREMGAEHDHNMMSYQKIGAEAIKTKRPRSSAGHNGGFQWGFHQFTSSLPLGMIKFLDISGESEQKVLLHEYFHAVQLAHIRTLDHEGRNRLVGPIWFHEGGAEWMAMSTHYRLFSEGRLKSWGFTQNKMQSWFRDEMNWKLDHARSAQKEHGCIERMAEASYGDPCRRFWYDGGAWAVAYLLDRVGRDALLTKFYPGLEDLGWEKSFQNTFGMTSKEFYVEFEEFFMGSKRDIRKVLPKY